MSVHKPSSPASSGEQSSGDSQCEVTAIQAPVAEGSGAAVNPAISLAVSPKTDENYTTESDGNQSSNQSGSESAKKPNCYECKYRRSLPYDAHSECVHPLITDADRILTGFSLLANIRLGAMKRMNVSCNSENAIRKGWFFWPLNFDPVWLATCDKFEPKSP